MVESESSLKSTWQEIKAIMHPQQPYLWVLLITIAIILSLSGFYLANRLAIKSAQVKATEPLITVKSEADVDQAPLEKKAHPRQEAVNLPPTTSPAKAAINLDDEYEEHHLNKLAQTAGLSGKVDWGWLVAKHHEYFDYLIFDQQTNRWSLAINDEKISQFIDLISTQTRYYHYVIFRSYKPQDSQFRTQQTANRISKLGYKAETVTANNGEYQIAVGKFANRNLALKAGESIYQFFKEADLLLADFVVKRQRPQIKPTDFSQHYLIDFGQFESFAMAHARYKQLTAKFDNQAIPFLARNGEKISLYAGFYQRLASAQKSINNYEIRLDKPQLTRIDGLKL